MGCTESIISEIVAKSNVNTQKGNINQAKVQPAPLLGRDEARDRRRKALMERHAKKQAMAQTISDNAMAEKERLSNSTWRSWRSGVNSDVISPAVSISVRGSDGTGSPDALPDPAMAYVYSEETKPSSPNEDDINANHMQIRTMELPNQVTEGTEGTSNQDEERLINERLSGAEEKKMAKKEGGTVKVEYTLLEEQDSTQEIPLNGNVPKGSRKDSKDSVIPLDNQKELMEKEKKRKRRGKQKAVKFSDQNLGDDDREESGQKKSKGR